MSNPNTSLSSSAKHKLIPSGASEYFSLSASHDIYFSLRMGDMELLEEAYALFNILRKYGHSPMIVGDIKQSLIQNLDNVKMLLVFGTEDYGTEPSWEYGTKAELQYCSENNKPYFVLEMCNQYTSPWTQKKLTEPGVAGCVWPHGTKMPERLGYVISRFYFDKVASIDELVDVLNSGWGLDKQDKYEFLLAKLSTSLVETSLPLVQALTRRVYDSCGGDQAEETDEQKILGDAGACEVIIKHLKKLMKSDSTDSSQAICSVCQAIRGLCRYDLNRQRFAEIGACETIVELLKYARNGFNVDIIISCCEAMRNLCFGSMVNKLTLVNAGVCIYLADCIDKALDTLKGLQILPAVCGAVRNICHGDEDDCRIRCFADKIDERLVRALMSSQAIDSSDVAIQCCGAIRNLSYGVFDGNRLRMGAGGACTGLIRVLDTWLSRSIDVAKEACVAINNLAANCVTNRDKFASLDVTRVLKSVVNHPTCRDTYAADAAKKAYKNFAKTIKS